MSDINYTNVLQYHKDFHEEFLEVLKKESLVGKEPWYSLVLQLEEVSKLLQDPVVSKELDNYKLVVQSPIEKLGLGNNILSLYEEGYEIKDITNILNGQGFNITVKAVEKWLKEYESEGVLTKASYNYGSVFDTQIQLQNLFESLNTMLEEIKNKPDKIYKRKDKDDILREYLAEIRQTIREAAQLASTVAAIKKAEEFQRIILEEINKESPITANKIISRITQLKNVIKTFDL